MLAGIFGHNRAENVWIVVGLVVGGFLVLAALIGLATLVDYYDAGWALGAALVGSGALAYVMWGGVPGFVFLGIAALCMGVVCALAAGDGSW